jgi:hypothetical protein
MTRLRRFLAPWCGYCPVCGWRLKHLRYCRYGRLA